MTIREGEEGDEPPATSADATATLRERIAEEVPVFDATTQSLEPSEATTLRGGKSGDPSALAEEVVGAVFDSLRAGEVDLDAAESQLVAGLSTVARGGRNRPLREAGIDATWLIEALPTPAFVVDPDHTILAYNEPLAELLGIEPRVNVGKDSRRITSSAYTDDRRERSLADKVIEAPRRAAEEFDVERVDSRDIYTREYVYHDTSVLHNRRGEEIEIAFVAVPVFDGAGELLAVLELVLENAGETLEEFPGLASVVSHDIRNPLSVVRTYVELAESDIDDEYYGAITRNVDRIEKIIDDVMTLAEGATEEVSAEEVHLEDVARRVWGSLDAEEASLETDPVAIEGAPHLMDRLLENLLGNAVQHGGEGVSVRLGSLPDGFYVEDDGPGIPLEERDAIFEHGYTTSDAGTGFGLPIVHTIVSNHGWEIAVMEGEAGGARFEIHT